MNVLVYDIESYPNMLCMTFLDVLSRSHKSFEISDRKDEWNDFKRFVSNCSNKRAEWVGFNNFGYDYQVLHRLLKHEPFSALSGEEKAKLAFGVSDRIVKMPKEEKFANMVWAHNHVVPQIDLFKIHHFDNVARATSLKKLEFNMRSRMIQDLPYAVGSYLTDEQKDEVLKYNLHDVRETTKLYEKSIEMIDFRRQLTAKYDKNFINFNDTKIGKEYFIMMLQRDGIDCYKYEYNEDTDEDERKPIQTRRDKIVVKDIIFPYVKFQRPEFNAVLQWLKKQELKETKAVFTGIDDLGDLAQYANTQTVKGKIKNLNCVIDGFQFDFGTGGIHGSVDAQIVEEDEHFAVIDYDVTSLYPSIAIQNNVYPEHLTRRFCSIYAEMKKDRVSYPKGTPENAMLKLALNGVYGDSNNRFSCFYDPQYTMTITINGQLMLCMLAEMHLTVAGLRIIQINTDGITVKVPRNMVDRVEALNKEWESITGLELERADYEKMFIRDVNNYIGLYTDGKLKRKGKYEYERAWHQDQSALVVQKAVEDHLVNGTSIEKFIREHDDDFDFMLRTNVPRSSKLLIDYGDRHEKLQNVTRYYISEDGGQLTKLMPALKQTPSKAQQKEKARTPGQIKEFESVYAHRERLGVKDRERVIQINGGFNATPLNVMGPLKNINFDWYIEEAHKLVDPLHKGTVDYMLQ